MGSQVRSYGLSLDVANFMRTARYPESYTGIMRDPETGDGLSPSAALTFLITQKAMGRRCIPVSINCNNPCQHARLGCTGFDYTGGGCPGHDKEPDGKPV